MSPWPEADFDNLVSDETGGNAKTLQSDYLPEGTYPIVDQGQSLIGGYTNDRSRVCKAELPVIVFGDHTKCFKYIDFPFCLGADGTKVLRPKRLLDERYLFYALQRIHIPDAGYSRHFKYLKEGKIPLPPLKEQKRIAAILDQADVLRRKRQRALDRLVQLGQAIFYDMFGDPVINPKQIRKAPLGTLLQVSSGSGLTAEKQNGGPYPVFGGNGINGWHDEFTVSAGTIVIGRVGVYCGAIHVTETDAWVTDNALVVSKKDEYLNTTYLRFALSFANLNQYAGRSAQPLVSGSRIYPVEILVPEPAAQITFEEKMVQCDSIKKFAGAHHGILDRLFASLQNQAFRDELSAASLTEAAE